MKNFTPLYELDMSHSEAFSASGCRLFIKRDDLFPVSFGGNKARKALRFFADLNEKGCDSVVTYGSGSSNHARIVANLAYSAGIECIVVSPNETLKTTNNSRLVTHFGAKTVVCAVSEVSATIERELQELRERGKNPYFIAGGGHGSLGTEACTECFYEILEGLGEQPDYIFHASGTGTTQAGLICGAVKSDASTKIVGISIARPCPRGADVVRESVAEFMGSDDYAHLIEFRDEWLCGGYGKYSAEQLSLMDEMLCRHGIPLDTTYTGKAFYGMTRYIAENQLRNKTIVFVHTGGTPLFFDDLPIIIDKSR